MEIINTKTHGYVDYMMGIFLLASPALFSLNIAGIESIVFYAAGATLIAYSVLTSYELGLIKVIPMKDHLILDVLSGIVLTASPWIFDFSKTVYMPHLVLGIIEIGAALLTQSKQESKLKVEKFKS